MPRTVRTDPPLSTWPTLAFAQYCYRVHGANPDLCQELREKIGYNYLMKVWVEEDDRYKYEMEIWIEKRIDIIIRCRNGLKRMRRVRPVRQGRGCLSFAFAKRHSCSVGCGCSFYRRPSECSACFDLFQE